MLLQSTIGMSTNESYISREILMWEQVFAFPV